MGNPTIKALPFPAQNNSWSSLTRDQLLADLKVQHQNVESVDAAYGFPPRPGTNAAQSDGERGIQSGIVHALGVIDQNAGRTVPSPALAGYLQQAG